MNIQLLPTLLPGCYELAVKKLEDERGAFVKTFNASWFQSLGLSVDWREQYYSISNKGVVRGLHFQLPPHDHAKLVYCIAGYVKDYVVDLRVGSPTFGKFAEFELTAEKGNMIYIPKGMAHGFCTLDSPATLIYNVTSTHHPDSDVGIHWDSIGIEWPISTPAISDRDRGFQGFNEFKSPFRYEMTEGSNL